MSQYIGIGYKMQVGKTTSAEIIKNIFSSKGISAKVLNFADPLKKFCVEVLGIDSKLVYGDNNAKNTLTKYKWNDLFDEIRVKYSCSRGWKHPSVSDERCSCGTCHSINYKDTLFGFLKTGLMTVREVLQVWGTDINRNGFNQDIWAEAPFYHKHDEKIIILADTRFPNEVDAIKQHGGIIMRMERDCAPKSNHDSEMALDGYTGWNYIIQNNSDIHHLYNKFYEIIMDEIPKLNANNNLWSI